MFIFLIIEVLCDFISLRKYINDYLVYSLINRSNRFNRMNSISLNFQCLFITDCVYLNSILTLLRIYYNKNDFYLMTIKEIIETH